MSNETVYPGGELELFAQARHWKQYVSQRVRGYVRGDVLEVGAGIGATTRFLCRHAQSWTCLEPNHALAKRCEENTRDLSPRPVVVTGTLKDWQSSQRFDAILYADVLEHIEDDANELKRAASFLKKDGYLVVLAPAHSMLFSAFDRAIGHYRRYHRRMLRDLTPPELRFLHGMYLDSAGLVASLGNRLFLKSSMPTLRQLHFWDRVLVPLSRWLDPIFGYRLGKIYFGGVAAMKTEKKYIMGGLTAALLTVYVFLGVSAMANKCTTFDEIAHLTAGYSYWVNHDFRLQPENGVFPQRWVALPLLFKNIKFPSLTLPSWAKAEVYPLGREFFYHLGNDPAVMLFWGRLMTALLGALLGFVIFLWSRELFGVRGAFFSLLLFALCPTMLAHGSLATSDMALTLFLTASVWLFWKTLHDISWRYLLPSLLAFGLLLISKMSALVIFPIMAVLVGARLYFSEPMTCALKGKYIWHDRKMQGWACAAIIAAHLAAGWAMIWAAYDFRYAAAANSELKFFTDWEFVLRDRGMRGAVIEGLRFLKLLPEAFLYGLAFVFKLFDGRAAFMSGHPYIGGDWRFFPYAFWVKTSLPFLVLLITAAGGWWLARLKRIAEKKSWYSFIPLAALVGVYGMTCLVSNLNLGHRHILPIYAALLIFVGANGAWLSAARWMRGAVIALVAWFGVESFLVRSHYLAYFNSCVGGSSQGYQCLVDSSLDWGQDLPGLKTWLDKNAGSQPVYFSYFGTGDPEFYGLKTIRMPGFFDERPRQMYAMHPGIYCVSATILQSLYLPVFGLWNESYEQAYRAALADFQTWDATSSDPRARQKLIAERGEAFWQARWIDFEQLRFARLCSFLRHREPDAEIGYSILIYRLDARDLRRALYDSSFEQFFHALQEKVKTD